MPTIEPQFPRTVVLPFAQFLPSVLRLLGYPEEMAQSHDFVFEGDVSNATAQFTLRLSSVTPKAPR